MIFSGRQYFGFEFGCSKFTTQLRLIIEFAEEYCCVEFVLQNLTVDNVFNVANQQRKPQVQLKNSWVIQSTSDGSRAKTSLLS